MKNLFTDQVHTLVRKLKTFVSAPSLKPIPLTGVILIFSILYSHSSVAQWVSGYSFKRKLTIAGSQVCGTGTLNNFPILVQLSGDFLKNSPGGLITNSNGYDIVFTATDQTTVLNHDVIAYDGVTGTFSAWVNVPTLSGGVDNDIYVYYGNSGVVSDPSTQNVWNTNYRTIYHFDNNDFNDATTNAINAVDNGTTNAAGKLGDARDLDGVSQYIQSASNELAMENNFTLSVWFKADATLPSHILWQGLSSENGWGNGVGGAQEMNLSTGTCCPSGVTQNDFLSYNLGDREEQASTDVLATEVAFANITDWQYAVVTVSDLDALPLASLYLNGTLASSNAGVTGVFTARNLWDTNLRIGRPGLATRFFNGQVDEVRISNTIRNADWICTEFNNQNNAATFTDTPNHAPDLASLEVANLSFTEGGTAVAVTSTIVPSDWEQPVLTGAVIRISSNYVNGEDVLAFTNAFNITGAFDATTGILTLSGPETFANYQSAIRSITYQNTNTNNPSALARTISFTINDGTVNSTAVTRNITVNAMSDVPVLSAIEAGALTYAEEQAATAITGSLVVVDVDYTNLSSATVRIITNYLSSEDVLAFTNAFGITGSFNATNGTLTLSGSASVANYESALRSVTYRNSNTAQPSTVSRVVSILVNDGTANSNSVIRSIGVTAVNDAPVLSSIEVVDMNYTEGQAATSVTTSITVADADNTNLSGATVVITNNFITTEDVLSFANANGITGAYDAATGTMTLTGSSSVANYQTALRNVKYRNSNNNAPSALTRTIGFTITDGVLTSNMVTRNILVAPVNDPPNAAADFFSTSSNTAVTANFRSNDTDAENNTINVNTTPVVQPLHGMVVISNSGSFIYTPNGTFTGIETFTYEICDDGAESGIPTPKCSLGIVSITINPVNPKFNIVGNNSIQISEQCFILTKALSNQQGAVWSRTPLDLRYSFELNFETIFSDSGVVKDSGADGIIFALQRDMTPPPANAAGSPIDARGSVGEYLGIGGVSPSIGIEIDTYQNGGEPAEDHIAISRDGSVYNVISPAVPAKVDGSNNPVNIEDGVTHTVKIAWDKPTNTLAVFFDGVQRTSYTGDVINTIFGGDPTNIYWGFSASTGGSTNFQGVCGIGLTPINLPAQASNDNVNVNEDNVLNASVLGNDLDPEGGVLKATAETKTTAHGNVSINQDGTYTYTPAVNYNGSDSFTYDVCDSYTTPGCAAATVNITVMPIADNPVALDDSYTLSEDSPFALTATGILVNDSDVDGSAITAILNATTAHGTLVLNSNGSFTYTPNANYNGNDSFTYRATDGTLNSPVQTVTLTISPVNDAPAVAADNASTNEDVSVGITVLSNDTDIDNAIAPGSVVTSTPAHGSTSVNTITGLVTYTPADDYVGPDSFTYTVQDGSGAISNSATVTLTILPVNDAPLAVDNTINMNEDSSVDIDVVSNDVDIDNLIDASSVSLGSTSTQFGGVSLNTTTGVFTYQPNTDYFGNDSFTYTVKDVSGLISNVATVTITVTPVNDAPIANNDVANTKQVAIDIAVLSNDIDIDSDFDPSSINVVLQPSNGTVTVNTSTGVVQYIPDPNYLGSDSFSYTVKDEDSATSNVATVFVLVEPSNFAPDAIDDGPIVFNTMQSFFIDALANDTDPDNDVLTVITVGTPADENGAAVNATVTIEDGAIVFHPSATDDVTEITFTYTIEDEGGLTDEAIIKLKYEPLTVSQGFSPNGDSQNDFWFIQGIESFPGSDLKVFDRWGLLVFKIGGYDNDSVVWDGRANTGTQNGKLVAQGTYYYILDLGMREKPKAGYVVIVR